MTDQSNHKVCFKTHTPTKCPSGRPMVDTDRTEFFLNFERSRLAKINSQI